MMQSFSHQIYVVTFGIDLTCEGPSKSMRSDLQVQSGFLCISRFGRSLQDLLTLINQLNDKGVQFKSLKEGDIDTTTPTGKLVFSIFASLAEFERETIKQRQTEGIAIAKANGIYKGRVKKNIDHNQFVSLYNRWQAGEIHKKYMAKKLNISMATLDRRISDYRKQKEDN